MKIAFTGSRSWDNRLLILAVLRGLQTEYRDELEICHGASSGGGADKFVESFARGLKIRQIRFPVDAAFDGFHRGAPLNRNRRMLETFQPELVIAFRADGKSNGTDNTIKTAEELGIPVVIYTED